MFPAPCASSADPSTDRHPDAGRSTRTAHHTFRTPATTTLPLSASPTTRQSPPSPKTLFPVRLHHVPARCISMAAHPPRQRARAPSPTSIRPRSQHFDLSMSALTAHRRQRELAGVASGPSIAAQQRAPARLTAVHRRRSSPPPTTWGTPQAMATMTADRCLRATLDIRDQKALSS